MAEATKRAQGLETGDGESKAGEKSEADKKKDKKKKKKK